MTGDDGREVAGNDADLALLVQQGQKIPAIKLYRERTGAGLKEAKDAVEAIAAGEVPAGKVTTPPSDDEIISLLQQGQKIPAIKLYRERTGAGLKESKEAVEAMAAEQGIASPARAGCLGAVILVLAGAVAAWAARS
jgi:ribosomal protein L7/L12